jgi:hypothetical protein
VPSSTVFGMAKSLCDGKVYVLCYESKFQEIGISPIYLINVQHFKLKKKLFSSKSADISWQIDGQI